MTVGRWALKLASAYLIVQVTVGVQLGVGIAWGVVVHQLPILLLSSVLMPLGLLLVLVQYPLAVRLLGRPAAPAE